MSEFADAIQDETIEVTHDKVRELDASGDRETYEEPIECTLTDEEQTDKRKRLESVDREIIRLEEEKKAAAKVFTNQIKPLQAERESILGALDSGTEKRMVAVYEHVVEDGAGNILRIEVRRVDTDAIVEERAPTGAEIDDHAESKQGDLFDGGGSQPPPVDAEFPEVDEDESLEPTAEALGQAAIDEERVVRTSSAEVKKKRAKKNAVANGAATE